MPTNLSINQWIIENITSIISSNIPPPKQILSDVWTFNAKRGHWITLYTVQYEDWPSLTYKLRTSVCYICEEPQHSYISGQSPSASPTPYGIRERDFAFMSTVIYDTRSTCCRKKIYIITNNFFGYSAVFQIQDFMFRAEEINFDSAKVK